MRKLDFALVTCAALAVSTAAAQAQYLYVPRTSYPGDGTVLELVVTNPDARLTHAFSGTILPAGVDGTIASETLTDPIAVAPKGTRVVTGPAGVGLWRLEGYAGLQLSARLRVPGGPSPRLGTAVPILNSENVHAANATVEVQSLLAATGFLSDVGLFNAGDQAAQCEARVSLADGVQVGQAFALDVAPLSFTLFEDVPGGLLAGGQVADARVSMRCDQSFFVLSRTVNPETGQVSIHTAATALASGLPAPEAPLTTTTFASATVETRTLTVKISLNGVVQATPSVVAKVMSTNVWGINCGTSCAKAFPRYAKVDLSAAAYNGYAFSNWTGLSNDCADGRLKMGDDHTCTANYLASGGGAAPTPTPIPPPATSIPPPATSISGTTSTLWGVSGELWSTTGRLADVSRAGYREGAVALPRRPVTHDVKLHFGAVGNGVADDTLAFKNAISSVSNGVIFIPKGTYKLSNALNINQSNLVLRGAGPTDTVLYFTIPVKDSTSLCKSQAGAGGWFGGMICVGFTSTIQEVGLEDFSIEFPPTSYPPHHQEKGYNGIDYAKGVSHSWVRNVTISDTDNGHRFRGHHITAAGLQFKAKWRTGVETSHHFIEVATSTAYNNLITDFVFDRRAMHDITVAAGTHHNVFSKGRGTDIAFDHHGNNPHDNVFTEINVGAGTRLWKSGGYAPHSGARETYWNIRDSAGRGPANAPGYKGGAIAPYVNIVGARYTKFTSTLEWVEGLNPLTMSPPNIYEAQLKRRLGYLPSIQ